MEDKLCLLFFTQQSINSPSILEKIKWSSILLYPQMCNLVLNIGDNRQ